MRSGRSALCPAARRGLSHNGDSVNRTNRAFIPPIVHFAGGELDGLKLTGFAVWIRRDGNGQSVTFPARQFLARGGEKRNFSLLRAIESPEAERKLRDFVLQAWAAYDVPEQAGASA